MYVIFVLICILILPISCWIKGGNYNKWLSAILFLLAIITSLLAVLDIQSGSQEGEGVEFFMYPIMIFALQTIAFLVFKVAQETYINLRK
jgi:hypothetical protein